MYVNSILKNKKAKKTKDFECEYYEITLNISKSSCFTYSNSIYIEMSLMKNTCSLPKKV